MTDIHTETIKVLNDLIETSKDGEAGFKDLAEHSKNPQLPSVFSSRAADTAGAATELQGLVRSLGGDPETTTSVSADLHRRWVDLKSAITGKDDAALLNEAERGEDVAKKSYTKALENQGLTPDIRADRSGRHLLMRQQSLDLAGPLRRQPRQHIFEISIRIVPINARRLDQAHDRRRPFAAAQRPGKSPVRPPKRPRPDQVLDLIVGDGHCRFLA